MQAIHDHIDKDTSFWGSVFNPKPLGGTTSGNQFDICQSARSSRNNPRLYLHGEIFELEETGISRIELSCYPDISMLFLIFFLSIPLFFFIISFLQNVGNLNDIIRILVYVISLAISFFINRIIFIYQFNNLVKLFKKILAKVELDKEKAMT
jgi:hypothetical protein